MSDGDWSGREFDVTVGDVAHGGHCVSRVEGRVVFVRHALPGERVRVRVTEDRGGSFCRGDAIAVLEASSDRVTPPCPVAGPGLCGGCDWQHAAPVAQRALKARVVAEQLERLAGVTWPVEVEALTDEPLRWRSRVRFVTGPDGRPGLRAHRSHDVIALEDCPITLEGAAGAGLARRARPGTEFEVAEDARGTVHLAEIRRGGRPKQVSGGIAVEHAADRTWRVAAHGFWQVHPAAASTLAAVVAEWAAAPAGGRVWDLYAGAGLFASVLAEQVGRDGSVLAIESGRRAVRDGQSNLSDLPQVEWHCGTVERIVSTVEAAADVVVLDPPRKGAGRGVVDAIADASPARVVYVACDPAALARDVATLQGHGYRMTALRAFDAFPMTHHVECVALLECRESGGGGSGGGAARAE
ncbi:tRNA/tmRNA/rRNA uracil-C5-methylase (TrmA/RlmC/RlmD family) [Prauserella sediminis]|uniref:tRNA/tmRNA/rRNA uracil-C5-methylase (TrmA/RlmC/RlmD family) n=1 Tax=Prauserella sediminis TaxID=577680 RepID=A0A839XQD1_9PSEU|nr:TRAM domain-containing protein [Prauserella sediminis]MBB3664941.1 tRNA/tmRNA/rRNA uracil-C5-methylase (TrmA/RlmC/RlmD family) [Prauserella sediminis]